MAVLFTYTLVLSCPALKRGFNCEMGAVEVSSKILVGLEQKRKTLMEEG
jgi:hypothetical protein